MEELSIELGGNVFRYFINLRHIDRKMKIKTALNMQTERVENIEYS